MEFNLLVFQMVDENRLNAAYIHIAIGLETIFLPLLLEVVCVQMLIHGSKIIISLVLLIDQKYQKPVRLWRIKRERSISPL
ncbi:MAG: hypothetical protein Q8J88_00705 [Bacteroidales bacterium]|nr:hypothetical protein [Bacteroidales bacterium]